MSLFEFIDYAINARGMPQASAGWDDGQLNSAGRDINRQLGFSEVRAFKSENSGCPGEIAYLFPNSYSDFIREAYKREPSCIGRGLVNFPRPMLLVTLVQEGAYVSCAAGWASSNQPSWDVQGEILPLFALSEPDLDGAPWFQHCEMGENYSRKFIIA